MHAIVVTIAHYAAKVEVMMTSTFLVSDTAECAVVAPFSSRHSYSAIITRLHCTVLLSLLVYS